MHPALAHLVVRRRWVVIVAALVAAGAAGVFGSGAIGLLKGGGLVDPASESTVAANVLADGFHAGTQNLVLLADAGAAVGGVDSKTATAAGLELTDALSKEPGVTDVVSYWASRDPALRSTNGRSAQVLLHVDGEENQALVRLRGLIEKFVHQPGPLDVRVAGTLEIERQLEDTITSDLTRAESIAVPVTLVLLLFVFGTLTAAALPLLIGGFSIVGTFAILRILESFTDVSVFALNLTTALALGLSIDYSLLMVSRFREELAAGRSPHDAAARCIQTAGRTIIFSSTTVAAALCSLLIFPQFFFRSFAYAGVAVCLLAAVGAAVVLPAALAVLGHRVEFGKVRRRRRIGRHSKGSWYRLAEKVMRRPALVAGAVTLILILLGLPFLGARFGLPDDRVLPIGSSSRQVADVIRTDYSTDEAGTVFVVDSSGHISNAAIRAYGEQLSKLSGVARVDTAMGNFVRGKVVSAATASSTRFHSGPSTYLAVVPDVEPLSAAGEDLVKAIRSMASPVPMLVGGQSAALVDAKASMAEHVPIALVVIGITTVILLFLMLGSLLLPLKAVVLNLLSLTALYGVMVWVFQDGHLSGVLGFTATGSLNLAIPVLMFCISFGLSMDYEVFLMSRIKEEHSRGADNVQAVARGLQRTGGIVTAAALAMSVVFLSFATSGVALIKLFGLGVTLAVLMDAAVIRPLLVPAFMKLAGPANWWAPSPLRAFHRRFGWAEGDTEDVRRNYPSLPTADAPRSAHRSVSVSSSRPTGHRRLHHHGRGDGPAPAASSALAAALRAPLLLSPGEHATSDAGRKWNDQDVTSPSAECRQA